MIVTVSLLPKLHSNLTEGAINQLKEGLNSVLLTLNYVPSAQIQHISHIDK